MTKRFIFISVIVLALVSLVSCDPSSKYCAYFGTNIRKSNLRFETLQDAINYAKDHPEAGSIKIASYPKDAYVEFPSSVTIELCGHSIGFEGSDGIRINGAGARVTFCGPGSFSGKVYVAQNASLSVQGESLSFIIKGFSTNATHPANLVYIQSDGVKAQDTSVMASLADYIDVSSPGYPEILGHTHKCYYDAEKSAQYAGKDCFVCECGLKHFCDAGSLNNSKTVNGYSWTAPVCTATAYSNLDPIVWWREFSLSSVEVLEAPSNTKDGKARYSAGFLDPVFQSQTCEGSIAYSNSPVVVSGGSIFGVTGKNVLSVFVLPLGATSVAATAFKGHPEITTLVVPSAYTKLGQNCFEDCTGLSTVVFNEGLDSIESAAFCNCRALDGTIVFPNSLSSIGVSAFSHCTSIDEIVLGTGFKYMQKYAFNDCTSLTKVTLPSALQSIGEGAFNGCSNLADIYFNGTRQQWNSVSKASGWNTGCPSTMTIHCTDD